MNKKNKFMTDNSRFKDYSNWNNKKFMCDKINNKKRLRKRRRKKRFRI